MLNLEQLNAFIAAAEKGSFSAAARHIRKSQSSVSIGVSNLELDLGVTLFDRSTKYPTLTEQGERLYQQAKILLRQAERIESYAQGAVEQVEDQVTIALDPLVPLYTIDSTLEKMAQKFPFTQVKLVKLSGEHLSKAILNDEVSIGIGLPSKAVPDNLDFVNFFELEWTCVCSPDSKFADMELVDNETLIAERQIVCSSMIENGALSAITKMSQQIWQAYDQDDLIRLVEQGLGWAFLPKGLLDEKLAFGTLIEFMPEFQRSRMMSTVEITWRSNLQHGPVANFIIEELTK
ncbi:MULTISPECIES: LysR family transcriptional regulator [unclassified Shewanella]|jgi:DNA-binding transcriptional LysR family regulator|uniref:LysR family transcriptional regulator n=1 Tax=unclassified Shewanella TaxID=196818 RepID=UPI000C7BD6D1|nr:MULTISPECIES: LysR family transcriptional regulator [unclassified Shewanella]PKG57940.1 LysR family transcriptional regulator [Shewanella sp. GutDb-MelDb]PKG73576.1 LysR family transcriptional regulator [Shewanella sp. GutCb]